MLPSSVNKKLQHTKPASVTSRFLNRLLLLSAEEQYHFAFSYISTYFSEKLDENRTFTSTFELGLGRDCLQSGLLPEATGATNEFEGKLGLFYRFSQRKPSRDKKKASNEFRIPNATSRHL